MSPMPPPPPDRHEALAVGLANRLPRECEGLTFKAIAGVLRAADSIGLLTTSPHEHVDAACACGGALILYGPRDEAAQRAIAEFVAMHGACTGTPARREIDPGRRRGMIAASLPATFTLPRCLDPRVMDWDERQAVVDAVLESIAAVDEFLDSEARR